MQQKQVPILIIGAGLQGASIALELASRGQHVWLVDQDSCPMNRASLRNEGKIHLGLIYAADTSLNTATLQLHGALNFYNLLKKWLGAAVNNIGISTPFMYLVANDSLMDAQQLGTHYDKLNAICQQQFNDHPHLNYLGQKPLHFATPATSADSAQFFCNQRIKDAFFTEERAINTDDLAREVSHALLNHPNIHFISNTRIEQIERCGDHTLLIGHNLTHNEKINFKAARVINATWEQRIALDRMAGIIHPPGWLHRLKYRVIAKLPDHLHEYPSATMVLGRYGDVVIRPDNTAYLSWYPSGLQGWSHEDIPPASWESACVGQVDALTAQKIGSEICEHISAWYPAMAASKIIRVDAGAILAYGQTDVDDKKSGLHDRTIVGLTGDQYYLSVDPGKLTTAPWFAIQAVNLLLDQHVEQPVYEYL